MITKGQEERLEERCRACLKKQGYKLAKDRRRDLYYRPNSKKYSITDGVQVIAQLQGIVSLLEYCGKQDSIL